MSHRRDHANPSPAVSAPRAFNVLAKPTGAQCNLDCDYCFFLSKEMLYPDSRFRMSDVALANWVGRPPGLCVHCETCGLGLALEHNGDLYSCDHYVEPDYKLGNIGQTPMLGLLASPRQHDFGQAKLDTLPRQCLD